METLLQNAINSIQIGIEDYQSEDSRRSISAVRNYYAGILLLAKAVLVKACPDVDLEMVLASKYKPILSPEGDLEILPDGMQTVDFYTIGRRFTDFNLTIDHKKLKQLNTIRNDIKHKYTELSSEKIKAEIAKTFEVLVELCSHLGELPVTLLGDDTWKIILEVHAVYQKELKECQDSFSSLKLIDGLELSCPNCNSELIYQDDQLNSTFQSMILACKNCGSNPEALSFLQHSIKESFTPKNLRHLTN